MAAKDAERNAENVFFSKRNEFPVYIDPLIELSPVAKRFYDFGPPFLHNHFPFWVATLIDRFLVFLVALLAVLLPLSQLMVGLKNARHVINENAHYAELIEINRQATALDLSIEELVNILERLGQINVRRANEKIKAGKEVFYFSFAETVAILQGKIEKKLQAKRQAN
jgi:hypothetical protein